MLREIFQLYPTTVHVTAVLVKYKTPTNRINKGVATCWLRELKPSGEDYPVAPIFIRKSQFRYCFDCLAVGRQRLSGTL